MNSEHPDELLDLCRQGSEEAKERLVAETYSKVHGYAYTVTRRKSLPRDYEDYAQEAYTRFFLRKPELKGSCVGYLCRIVRNTVIDDLRRPHIIHGEADQNPDRPTLDETRASPEPGPELEAESREDINAVRQAVLDLRPKDRAILLLRMHEGLPYSEIAERMQMTEVAAKKSFERTKTALRNKLARYFGESNNGRA